MLTSLLEKESEGLSSVEQQEKDGENIAEGSKGKKDGAILMG
ncbi:MAG: hypothetical protein UX61_C0018G0006 [Parcubacteria group bacterium GW2011_GWA2_46_7]|nr:MAG: hypothetical protein UX61_C0018G0006 [Parcubacteria group bacterium GW2011_GWA2_46_7]